MTNRVDAEDLVYLAMDTGPVPQQFAAVLVLEPDPGPERLARVLADRIAALPRLRQRIAGRHWVDDPVDVRRRIRQLPCPAPGDRRALLDLATSLVLQPIPHDGPLWTVTVVTGLAGDRVALVVVLHHALADGIGGLAVLTGLADDSAPPVPPAPVPTPRTGRGSVLRAGGGLRPPAARDCSLVRRTGPRRRVAVVREDLAAVRAAAHHAGVTVNDAVLVAVGGALAEVLAGRGEEIDSVAVAVPAARPSAGTVRLGNRVAPILVSVPVTGALPDRLRTVSATVRARRAYVTGAAPIALLGAVFLLLTRLGAYRWYLNHQRRLHTVVSHVRGPDRPVSIAGARVTAIIPLAVAEAGNCTVSFDVLSYAGTLTVTAVVDPEAFPDLPVLTRALHDELAMLSAPYVPH